MKKQVKKAKMSIIGMEGFGLYYGEVRKFDAVNKIATVKNCRHIFRWYGGTGGITSLAAWGPCGDRADHSRIGEPCEESIITKVAAIHLCSDLAVKNFAKIKASK